MKKNVSPLSDRDGFFVSFIVFNTANEMTKYSDYAGPEASSVKR